MKGLILAGGHGTRLRPLTHTGPKQLIPIANKANILYCLEDLRDAGITDIGVILGDVMPEKVRELLGDGRGFGVRITYLVQGFPAGIAHAIQCAESFMGPEPFCAYLGDNVLKGGIRPMVEEVEAGARVEGRVRIGARSVVKSGSVIRGPVVIGQDCIVGPETYVGPYTSIGDASRLVGADIESSIVIGEAVIETRHKIVNSLIGRYATIRSADGRLPKGQQLIIGENSSLFL